MGINIARVIKFIRKGDNGRDAVRYWLIPSVTSISVKADGVPSPAKVSCRLVKQIGDDTPVTVTDHLSEGLEVRRCNKRSNGGVTMTQIYNGGELTVPTTNAYCAMEFYLARTGYVESIDTVTIPIVRDGDKGDQGDKGDKGDKGDQGDPGADGQDAISIKVSPQTIMLKRNGKSQRQIRVYVDLFKGETLIPYADETQGNMLCSVLNDNEHTITEGLVWNFGTDNGRFFYSFTYRGTTDINLDIPFTVTYNGKEYPEKILVRTVADGSRGPALRGPQAWSDCAVGYEFQSGAEGEEYKDVVLYGDNYYSCVRSHTKTAENFPQSNPDEIYKYWQLASKVEMVATKILLASYALVKNLGVEAIDMKDADGNILFQAKDGNVVCKTGTFENIKVSGDIVAESLNLKVSTAALDEVPNGSICIGTSGIVLPELPVGTTRSIKVLNSGMSRSMPEDLLLKPENSNVLISPSLSQTDAKYAYITLPGRGYNSNTHIELIGMHFANSDYTFWLLSSLNNGITTE